LLLVLGVSLGLVWLPFYGCYHLATKFPRYKVVKMNQEAQKIIQRVDEAGDIFPLEDGFYYYGSSGGGALSSWNLRVIADELDKRNKDWDDQLNEHFEKEKKMEQFDTMTVANFAIECAMDACRDGKTSKELKEALEDFDDAASKYSDVIRHRMELAHQDEVKGE